LQPSGRELGLFTCIVEAELVDSTVEKLRDLVTASKAWFAGYEAVENVYLNDLIEIEQVPTPGVLAHFEHTYDNPSSSITSLRGSQMSIVGPMGGRHGRRIRVRRRAEAPNAPRPFGTAAEHSPTLSKLTMKNYTICCRPVVVLFWSRELPAKSLAPVVTTAW
jgi:hypothetical protein